MAPIKNSFSVHSFNLSGNSQGIMEFTYAFVVLPKALKRCLETS